MLRTLSRALPLHFEVCLFFSSPQNAHGGSSVAMDGGLAHSAETSLKCRSAGTAVTQTVRRVESAF